MQELLKKVKSLKLLVSTTQWSNLTIEFIEGETHTPKDVYTIHQLYSEPFKLNTATAPSEKKEDKSPSLNQLVKPKVSTPNAKKVVGIFKGTSKNTNKPYFMAEFDDKSAKREFISIFPNQLDVILELLKNGVEFTLESLNNQKSLLSILQANGYEYHNYEWVKKEEN